MVGRNNAGRLGAGFISVCIETRWLGHFGGFYVLEPYCTYICMYVCMYAYVYLNVCVCLCVCVCVYEIKRLSR